MIARLFSCFLLLSLSVASCTSPDLRVKEYHVAADVPNPSKPSEEFYQIGPGDTLGILLWKEPALSGSVKVRPDGYVSLPLVNEVQVTGLTTGGLRKILEEKYKQYVTDPFVSIRVEGISSVEVFLVGQVTKPGAYPLSGNESLLQILTRAGGLRTGMISELCDEKAQRSQSMSSITTLL
jgi:protein involved in polysaccharide export with SLBB domain